MKQFKILLLSMLLFLYSCGTVKEGFSNQKKNSSDEFLVEKKSPLVMPPDYNQLPLPEKDETKSNSNENKIKKLVTNNEDMEVKSEDLDQSLEESLLKKIKKN